MFKHRRSKQLVSFKDRLAVFVKDLREGFTSFSWSGEGELAQEGTSGRYRAPFGRLGQFTGLAAAEVGPQLAL
jgi:hypothetical protein